MGLVQGQCPARRRIRRRPVVTSGHKLSGRGEQAKPQAAGLPETGLAGRREHRHPGQQVESDLHDLQPDPVRGRAVQGQVAQAGGPDMVLGLARRR